MKFVRVAILLIAIAALTCSALIFWPAEYDVTVARDRPGTRYWQLSTGSRIAYWNTKSQGSHQRGTVIYLHGGPGAGITDKELQTVTQLSADGYSVYLYDQIGCGRSGRLENIKDYNPARHLRDLENIVDVISAEKVILIGQSWGSILCLMYIAAHPEKVDKLIIPAPGNIQPPASDLPETQEIKLKPHYKDRRYQLITFNPRARATIYAARKLGLKLVPDREADKLLTFLTSELNKSMVCDTSLAVKAEGTEGFYSHYMTLKSLGSIGNLRDKLELVKIPVLIMKGECDIQPWKYTAEYLKIFPHAKFRLIKNGGHNLFTEQPAEYIGAIKEFLKE